MTTLTLSSGLTITTDREPIDLDEFRRRGEAAGWRFRCPSCGHVASMADFRAIGADPSSVAEECLGRHRSDVGCNWAAYGFLGTLDAGVLVRLPDGRIVEAFAPAEAADG